MTAPPRADVTIVSGGQTGADRAALDWALARGRGHGGWCPRGRRAEDGPIPGRYRLRETASEDYRERTEGNVRDSDATVILSLAAELTGGSAFTVELAGVLGKPWLHCSEERDGVAGAATALRELVARHGVRVLNVAGPRASGAPGIERFVAAVLEDALG